MTKQQMNRLEKIATVTAYGFLAAGAGIGGALSYIEKNPMPFVYGVTAGAILMLISLMAPAIRYRSKYSQNQPEQNNQRQ